jgi:two-component system NtrC family sensor kinase
MKNSYQAIKNSGKGDTIEIKVTKENRIVKIEISDNGPGIPENIRSFIFDPFFSTKKFDEGMGLGLSIVESIVSAHNGEISVISEVGKGTTFIIEIPEDLK